MCAALAEAWADDGRAICPECGKRRCNRGHSVCTECEWAHQIQLEHKRRWWNAYGQANRTAEREAGAE